MPTMEDRRDPTRSGDRCLGRVVSCDGSRATIAALAEKGTTELTELWSVGRLISINVGDNRVVAMAHSMEMERRHWTERDDNTFFVDVELLGEVRVDSDGREAFSTGISCYPYLGSLVHRIRVSDLECVYSSRARESQRIGYLSQDETVPATIHIPSMLSKHFAVVGSTGAGKSTAVSLLLAKAIAADPRLRVLILDPHNEFAAAFPDESVVIDTDTLDLPFWLMRLDEFAEVVFRGRLPVPDELDVLRDLIPEAKRSFKGGTEIGLMRRPSEKSSVTADTPVPYRMADLLALIDERMGRLEGRNEKPVLRTLKMRLIAAVNDPRYRFMFSSNTINDTIMETLAHIFRIPGDGRPIGTFHLSGIPSEVVNSVVSVLCRMAFEIALWSNGVIHLLVVCEEAHRYVPSDTNSGFIPTRQAIARIAKEGRKYGVSLGIITQRPGELDQTILSQCSTLFAMRLANENDKDIIRSAIPNSSISTTNVISSMGNGEAIAFGEAIAVPMRMRFERVDASFLPKASSDREARVGDETPDTMDLRTVVTRMRAVAPVDIGSNLKNAVMNVYHKATERAPYGEGDEGGRPIDTGSPPWPSAASGPIEPYRTDMLPTTRPASGYGRIRSTARADVFREPTQNDLPVYNTAPIQEPSPLRYTSPPVGSSPGYRPPAPGSEARASLRESILRKPPGSLPGE